MNRLSICVGGVVLKDDKVLLVRQKEGDLKGMWSIPWGYVNLDEFPDLAVLREIREEAGIEAKIEGLLGMQNYFYRGESQLHIIFLCSYVSGTPNPDMVETDKAQYFSLGEIYELGESIETFCRWIVIKVLTNSFHLIPLEMDIPYKPYIGFF